MAKSSRKKKTPPPAAPVDPGPPPAVQVHSDQAAEEAFTDLPPRLEESLVVVRYTGRKRVYIHYGRAGGGVAFWYLIRSDGPRLMKVYPAERAIDCFAELHAMLVGWRAQVNSDPMSPSYCDISPDEDQVLRQARRHLGLADDPEPT